MAKIELTAGCFYEAERAIDAAADRQKEIAECTRYGADIREHAQARYDELILMLRWLRRRASALRRRQEKKDLSA